MSAIDFDQLAQDVKDQGVDSALEQLATELKQQKKYHQMFNTRQMQIRQRLGLSVLVVADSDTLDPTVREKLEKGYIAACREVGELLLEQGKIAEAWSYLQIIGDQENVAQALKSIELNDDSDEENVSELIDIALYQGVDPQLGFDMVLKFYGTCNAITAIEGVMHGLAQEKQLSLVGSLVRHLHAELLDNVKAGVAELVGTAPEGNSISDLLTQHDSLMKEQGYHIDTSHLSSTVQLARLLEDKQDIRLAIELAEYGSQLDDQLKFPGEAPFSDLYKSLKLYLSAMIGTNEDAAVDYFKQQAEAVEIEDDGSLPAEVYIRLLARIGRYDQAFDETLRLIPADVHTTGFGPNLMELAGESGMYDRLKQICRDQNDLLGFVAGLVDASTEKPS